MEGIIKQVCTNEKVFSGIVQTPFPLKIEEIKGLGALYLKILLLIFFLFYLSKNFIQMKMMKKMKHLMKI